MEGKSEGWGGVDTDGEVLTFGVWLAQNRPVPYFRPCLTPAHRSPGHDRSTFV